MSSAFISFITCGAVQPKRRQLKKAQQAARLQQEKQLQTALPVASVKRVRIQSESPSVLGLFTESPSGPARTLKTSSSAANKAVAPSATMRSVSQYSAVHPVSQDSVRSTSHYSSVTSNADVSTLCLPPPMLPVESQETLTSHVSDGSTIQSDARSLSTTIIQDLIDSSAGYSAMIQPPTPFDSVSTRYRDPAGKWVVDSPSFAGTTNSLTPSELQYICQDRPLQTAGPKDSVKTYKSYNTQSSFKLHFQKYRPEMPQAFAQQQAKTEHGSLRSHYQPGSLRVPASQRSEKSLPPVPSAPVAQPEPPKTRLTRAGFYALDLPHPGWYLD